MPTEAIHFDGQASGLDALSAAPPLVVNVITDLSNTIRMRPGISAWSGFPSTVPSVGGSAPSPVDCMVPFGAQLIYVTRDRKLWACSPATATVTALSDPTTATQLLGTSRPLGLAFRTKVVFTGGSTPQSTTGSGLSATLGGSPPDASSIVGIATRAVVSVNDTSGTFRWSGLGDTGHTTWDPLNFAEAEAKPDTLPIIADNTNELFGFGSETLQVFSPDAVLGFAPGRTLNLGCIAPYSVTKVDDMFGFLDRERRFVVTDGRSFSDDSSVVSKPIEASLKGLSSVSDCFGFRMRTDRWDAVVWMFPTDGKGFIWNRRNNQWSEWRGWDPTMGYAAPTISSAVFWPEQNVFLVGLTTGQIAKLDAAAFTDLGATVKVELTSGFVDHGTDAYKQNHALYLTFRRGQTAQGTTAPRVLVSWRNDIGAWSRPQARDLGNTGDTNPVVELRSLGVYRRRQWRIESTAAAEISFVSAREDFTVAGN